MKQEKYYIEKEVGNKFYLFVFLISFLNSIFIIYSFQFSTIPAIFFGFNVLIVISSIHYYFDSFETVEIPVKKEELKK